MRRLLEYAQGGISTLAKHFNTTTFINKTIQDPDFDRVLESYFAIKDVDIKVFNDTVEYSYSLKERQQLNATRSRNITHSTASCNTIYINGSDIYHFGSKLKKIIGMWGGISTLGLCDGSVMMKTSHRYREYYL